MGRQARTGEWVIFMLEEPLVSSSEGPVTGPSLLMNADLNADAKSPAGTLPSGSPYGTPLEVHVKPTYVYLCDGIRHWKLFKIWVSKRDGSFHRVNYAYNEFNPGKPHYTYHPSGLLHWADGMTHNMTRTWSCFRELKAAPVDTAIFTAGQFDPGNRIYRKLEVKKVETPNVTFSKPAGPKQEFEIAMRLGKPELVETALTRAVPVNDQIVDRQYIRLASFVDPSADPEYRFDVGFAVALQLHGTA